MMVIHMLLWLYIFMASLAAILFMDIHIYTKRIASCEESRDCQPGGLRETLLYNMRRSLFYETALRLAPLALVQYGILHVNEAILLITFNAGFVMGVAYIIYDLSDIALEVVGMIHMVSLWMLLLPLLGLWLTYAVAITFRIIMTIVVFYMVMANVKALTMKAYEGEQM